MKKMMLFFTVFVFLFFSFTIQQESTGTKYYTFGEKVYNLMKAGDTDSLFGMLSPDLNDTQKEVITSSLLTTINQIKLFNGFNGAQLLNVLQKKLKSGNVVLYLPVLKGNKIYTIRIGGVSEQDGTLYISGPVKLAGEKSDKELTEGYRLFLSKCFACHGRYGEGSIGPNLTDDYWKYVKQEGDIFNVIKKGKQGTMMIAFEKYLNDDQIKKLVKYINLMNGQHIKKGKAPEGNKVTFQRNVY